jgi:hypothetical protein
MSDAPEQRFEGLCTGGPKDGEKLSSWQHRVTIPMVHSDQMGIGAGYYQFDAESKLWLWRGESPTPGA